MNGNLPHDCILKKHHISAYIGLLVSAACLILFGADSFMLPTMAAIIALLAASRRKLEKLEVNEV